MNRRRVIIGLVVFIFAGLMIYTFANPTDSNLENEPNTQIDDSTNNEGTNDGTNSDPGLLGPGGGSALGDFGPGGLLAPGGGATGGTGTTISGETEGTPWEREGSEEWLDMLWGPLTPIALMLRHETTTNQGELTIVKNVIGRLQYEETFQFVITGKDYQNRNIPPVTVNITIDPETNTGVSEKITLPYGAYTVTEVGAVTEVDGDGNVVKVDDSYYSMVGGPKDFTLTSRNQKEEIYIQNDPTTIEISKVRSDEGKGNTVLPGDIIEYTVTLTNTGESFLKNGSVIDTLGNGLTYLGLSSSTLPVIDTVNADGTITFTIDGDENFKGLAPKESVEIVYTVKVNDDVKQGDTLRNTVVGTGDNVYKKVKDRTRDKADEMIGIYKNKTNDFNKNEKEVYPGATLTYKITAGIDMNRTYNTTKPIARNVVITDTLSDNLTYVEDSLVVRKNGKVTTDYTLSQEFEEGTLSITFVQLKKSDKITITYKAVVDETATSGDTVKNGVVITCTPDNNVICDDEPIIVEDPVVVPNVVITKDSNNYVNGEKVPVQREQVYSYTITVTNEGDGTAYDVKVTDMLPGEVIYVSSSPAGTYSRVNRTVSWSLGNFAPGQTEELTVTVRVRENIPSGTITNTAVLSYLPTEDGDEITDIAIAEDEIIAPVINVAKTSDATELNDSKVLNGETIEYTITVTNTGDAPATNVIVRDILPNHITVDETTIGDGVYNRENGTITWIIDRIDPGAENAVEITFTVAVDVKVKVGTPIKNEVKVYETNNDGNKLNKGKPADKDDVTDVVVKPALRSTKTGITDTIAENEADKKIVTIGNLITYTITIYNDGDGVAKNVTITDIIPAGTKLVPGTITGPVTEIPATGVAGETIKWVFGEIPANTTTDEYTVSFKVEVVNKYGDIVDGNKLTEIKNIANYIADNAKKDKTNKWVNPLLKYGDLTINKEVVGNLNYEETFQFEITGKDYLDRDITTVIPSDLLTDGKLIVSVTVDPQTNTGKINIPLPYGTYKITEIDNEFYSFQKSVVGDSETDTVTLTATNKKGSITVYNDPTKINVTKTSSAEGTTVLPGDVITYTIRLTNTGNSTLKNGRIVDTFGTGLTYLGLSSSILPVNVTENADGTITFDIIGDESFKGLAPSESVEIVYTVRVNDDVKQGDTLRNAVVGTGDNVKKERKDHTKDKADELIGITKDKTNDFHDEKEVYPGATLTYTITAGIDMTKEYNTDKPVARNVTITDQLEGKIAYVTDSLVVKINGEVTTDYTGKVFVNGELELTFAKIKKTDVIEITYQAKVSDEATDKDTVKNGVVVTCKENNNVICDDEPIIIEDPVVTPKLSITKVSDTNGAKLERDQEFSYTIRVENKGSGTAYNVNVMDFLPGEVIYLGSDPVGTYSMVNRTVAWSLGNFAPGQTEELTVTVRVRDDVISGTITNNVVVTGETEDGKELFDDAIAEDEVIAPIVEVAKTSDATELNDSKVLNGENIEYTITVTNTGDAPAYNVTVKDILPNYVTVNEDTILDGGIYNPTDRTITWIIDVLEPGAENAKDITFTVTTDVKVKVGTPIKNQVEVYEDRDKDKPVDKDEVIDVVVKPALSSTKTGVVENTKQTALDKNMVTKGSIITYTITVTNDDAATGAAKNVRITDTIPAGTKLVEGSITGPFRMSGNTIIWEYGTTTNPVYLDPGASYTVTFQVEVVNKYGDIVDGNKLTQITNTAYHNGDNTKKGKTKPWENPLMKFGTLTLDKTVIEPFVEIIGYKPVKDILVIDKDKNFNGKDQGIKFNTEVEGPVIGIVDGKEVEFGYLVATRVGDEWIFDFKHTDKTPANINTILQIDVSTSYKDCNSLKGTFEVKIGTKVETNKNGLPSAETTGNNVSLCLTVKEAYIESSEPIEEFKYRALATNLEVFKVNITGTDIMGNDIPPMYNVLIDKNGNILSDNITLPYGTYTIVEVEAPGYSTRYFNSKDQVIGFLDGLEITIDDNNENAMGYIKNKILNPKTILERNKTLAEYESKYPTIESPYGPEGGFNLWR